MKRQDNTRTRILDLPESFTELSADELRIVSGGLMRAQIGCNATVAFFGGKDRTQYVTNGDWDTD